MKTKIQHGINGKTWGTEVSNPHTESGLWDNTLNLRFMYEFSLNWEWKRLIKSLIFIFTFLLIEIENAWHLYVASIQPIKLDPPN